MDQDSTEPDRKLKVVYFVPINFFHTMPSPFSSKAPKSSTESDENFNFFGKFYVFTDVAIICEIFRLQLLQVGDRDPQKSL